LAWGKWSRRLRRRHLDRAGPGELLARAYQDLEQLSFVKAAFYFNLRDYLPGLANPDPSCFAHYGLETTYFKRKPAGVVFASAAAAARAPAGG
jgi:hypothetical protein